MRQDLEERAARTEDRLEALSSDLASTANK